MHGAILAMAMKLTSVRVRRTPKAARKGPGKGREPTMGRGMARGMGRGKGRGMGRGRVMVKGMVMLNKPQGEMISVVLLLAVAEDNVRGRSRYRRLTRVVIFIAGSIASHVNFLR